MRNIALIPVVLAALFTSLAVTTIGSININAQTASTTTTTTTTPAHFFHGGHLAWRSGHANPNGIYQGANIVTIPSSQLAQNVVNNCPSYAPVLLSTGVCETQQQALTQESTGTIAAGGQVQALGQVVVGTPTILSVHNYNNPFTFLSHFHGGSSHR
jgi:hypothetical protein